MSVYGEARSKAEQLVASIASPVFVAEPVADEEPAPMTPYDRLELAIGFATHSDRDRFTDHEQRILGALSSGERAVLKAAGLLVLLCGEVSSMDDRFGNELGGALVELGARLMSGTFDPDDVWRAEAAGERRDDLEAGF